MSEPAPDTPTIEPTQEKPTVTKVEPVDPKIPEVVQQQVKDMSKELKELRKELKQERADKEAAKLVKERDDTLVELKKLKNKPLYEKYKEETDASKIQQAIDDHKLTKKDFPQLIADAEKDDSNKIPTGIDPGTGKIVKH